MSGNRTGPGRERPLDPTRNRRETPARERLAYASPLVHKNGRVALAIDPRSEMILKAIEGRGLHLELVALKAALDALP